MRVDLRAATVSVYERHVPRASQDRFNRPRLRLANKRRLVCRRLISVAVVQAFRHSRFDGCDVNFDRLFVKVVTVDNR